MADTTGTTATIPTSHRNMSLFFDIPELTAEVAQHLSFYQYTQCVLVSKTFYNAFQPLVWKHFDSPLDIPSYDPSLIRRNVPHIRILLLSVADHDVLPMFTDGLPLQSNASPSLFFRAQLPVSGTRKEKEGNQAGNTPLITTLPSSFLTLSAAMNNLSLINQPRCTNLTTLSFSNDDISLSPKQHLLFHSNILTLLLNSPYITSLHIPADLLALHPQFIFDTLQHHLPRLEELALGPVTSKAYTFAPSSASLDNADLGLDDSKIAMVAQFSGMVDWETTVQLLETVLWKRRRTTKTSTSITHLRCRYTIPDDFNTFSESDFEAHIARLRSLSSSTSTSTSSSTTSLAAADSNNNNKEEEIKVVIEEPRLTYLVLPRWGPNQSTYSHYLRTEKPYIDNLVRALIEQLPYLALFSPHLRLQRFLEGEVECHFDDDENEDDGVVGSLDINGDGDDNGDDEGTAESIGKDQGNRSNNSKGEGKEERLEPPRYRWRVKEQYLCPYDCSLCYILGEQSFHTSHFYS